MTNITNITTFLLLSVTRTGSRNNNVSCTPRRHRVCTHGIVADREALTERRDMLILRLSTALAQVAIMVLLLPRISKAYLLSSALRPAALVRSAFAGRALSSLEGNKDRLLSSYKRPPLVLYSGRDNPDHPSATNKPFYITTPIYYVNGEPHLGHAYTSVIADVIARYERCSGREVFFLTGTDEHGQKVEQSAVAAGKTPLEFADGVSAKFRNLVSDLGCSNDDFIRTTEPRHAAAVAELWRKLEANGQIYLGAYEGWYSIRDEAFYSESELVDGRAPTGAEVQWVKEESYFFRLSQYTDRLLKHYEANPDFILPKSRRNEVVSFVGQEGGLKDLSVSRTTFQWGLPVPGDPKHVVYVWLDALTNYLTAAGFASEGGLLSNRWPAAIHVVGKDILRFHAVFWPAFLMAADLELPQRVYAHGWWTKNGEKMSKSVGNVLDPQLLLQMYGKDYLRYFLVAEIVFGNDGDFTHEAFVNRCNSDLANDIGNLAQRCLTFIAKNCEGRVPRPGPLLEIDENMLRSARESLNTIDALMGQQNLKAMCEEIVAVAKLGNKYIDVTAPWTLRKTDPERMKTVMYVLAEVIRTLGVLLSPIMPDSCDNLLDQLGLAAEGQRHLRTLRSLHDSSIEPGTLIGSPSPVFPKLEPTVTESASARTAAAPAPKVVFEEVGVGMDLQELETQIVGVGERVRQLKASGADKERLRPLVQQLLAFKERFKAANGGQAYQPKA